VSGGPCDAEERCTGTSPACPLDVCAPSGPDDDGDGEQDSTDPCPSTPLGADVDQAGCSIEEFCARFDATTRDGARACKKADWKNDEPVMRGAEADCAVDKGSRGTEDDRCVPAEP
jgi:hypothetical protein